ncbi:hypothetical protein L917_04794, partial [Phytophthora nicotianae]
MWALKSPHRFLTLAVITLLALATTTMTASATKQVESTQRRLVTSLADAPSLRLQFTLKRDTMKVYGQNQFYVFANPVVSSDNTS